MTAFVKRLVPPGMITGTGSEPSVSMMVKVNVRLPPSLAFVETCVSPIRIVSSSSRTTSFVMINGKVLTLSYGQKIRVPAASA